jgi:Protein of unknown function (DUF3987)
VVAPTPLLDPWAKYIVPPFPLGVLPGVLQDYVGSQSEVLGVDPSAMAVAALTTISGALDHRFAVKMMRGGNWREHPRLWSLLCGDPSTRKTPCINDATHPLELHQADIKRDYDARLRDYKRAKKAKQKGVEEPDPPVRWVVFDSTVDKLGDILARSDKGLLVKRDEFSGWIGDMERYEARAAARPTVASGSKPSAAPMAWIASDAAKSISATCPSPCSAASSPSGWASCMA